MAERPLVVVANRLPVARDPETGGWSMSPGGLVRALLPILQAHGGSWVGWPGADETLEPFRHEGVLLAPVEVSREELESFYLGFSNSTLWPLYHDAVRWPEFHRHWWRPYAAVNERFAEAAAEVLEGDEMVWVQDYHLQLVPKCLRERRPDARIGFFLHIPFPPVELFAQLPWRRQILEGLLAADVVGFQTVYGARNFARACRRFLKVRGSSRELEYGGRTVRVGGFPISIDAERYRGTAESERTRRRAAEIRESLGDDRTIYLGVDRLDYTKGIDRRLRAYETFLEGLEDPSAVTFVQVAVPSREIVPQYAEMRSVIEELVGRINGRFGSAHHTPVHYMYRGLATEELVAHYLAADVMAVTPLRDGMNLVAKEYVTCRVEDDGVLVLSEFTGAARELGQTLLVNPHDIDGIAAAYAEARHMPLDEQRRRMRSLRRRVARWDVHAWAGSFLSALES